MKKADLAKAYLGYRQTLGVLGMSLPALVLLLGLLGHNQPGWYNSISASFYGNAGPVFVAIMGATGVYLITYGVFCWYSTTDIIANTLSGVFALLIAFFPCGATSLARVGVLHIPTTASAMIHNAAATAFFLLLAYNILFLFTKTSGTPTPEKIRRNRVYYVCGVGMLCFLLSQVITTVAKVGGPATMVNEAGMLLCFGVAWLVKGGAMMADRKGSEQIKR